MKTAYLLVGLVAAVTCLGAHAADKFYKWKDANGIVHFTDTPPPQGTEFESVAVKGAAAITQSNSADAARKDEAAASDAAAADASGDKKTAANDVGKARCEQAQQRLTILEGQGDVSVEENGKAVRLNKDRRAAEINVAKAQVQAYCSPAKGS